MAQIYLLKYDEIDNEEVTHLSRLVSNDRRQKISKYADVDKRRQSLFAKLLLRAVLCRQFGVSNDSLKFSADVNGKPYVEDLHGVFFSISHTSSAVCVAVSQGEIGVDIERVRPINIDIAKRYFTFDEYQYVLDGGDKLNERFMFVWTRKEAAVKKSGVGFKQGFSGFSVFDSDDTDFETYYVDDLVISESGDMAVEFIGNDRSREILQRFIEENRDK